MVRGRWSECIVGLLYAAVGCNECNNLGFKGRVGVQEVLAITPDLRDAICKNMPEPELNRLSLQNGFVNMFRDGLGKAVSEPPPSSWRKCVERSSRRAWM